MPYFNEPIDQDVIDEHNEAPAVVRRKQARSAMALRRAQDAHADQQMLHELGLTKWDLYD